ncbi:1-deoxy-D-xylulose-5-phosphate reductoisomerase [Oceanirhabdus sp. W0125-5]|uniref:1-deoxy-D-xylulose-5-phosphate reductoisomerase n=1 Tax=Oceanirhabdus sp. W0125-5 TaxID=2999116 RepID=UPI0022F2D487|nr:1-deoxy-D-xylulose-5-phosphate reductoisomerase [Oceanirhabdus sp. W0125-5]WBW94826.1 1-deoxy-D-xylulose-5-phosphate reductoisomerase [Oceanirhabdus sp. W0125-5]
MKNIGIIGATGSIGSQTIEVLRENREAFNLTSISAHSNYKKTIEIIDEFSPEVVVVTEEKAYGIIKDYCKEHNKKIDLYSGVNALEKVSEIKENDILVTSVVGMVGLKPTMKAIENGTTIALANKETLVAGGIHVMEAARKGNVDILPVDSEHNALFQCLQGEKKQDIKRLHITASGGPFRGRKKEELINITPEDAVRHPKWNMGMKISVDSSTLMNKGLEVIEAHWLYGVDYDKINVVVHPESIIHSMVEYKDNSVIAQLSNPDMKLPIQYALTYPERIDCNIKELNLFDVGQLTFLKPDTETFDCLKLAYQAGKAGGNAGVILNTSNEVAVDLFLKGSIKYLEINEIVERCLNNYEYMSKPSLDDIIHIDKRIRKDLYDLYLGGK